MDPRTALFDSLAIHTDAASAKWLGALEDRLRSMLEEARSGIQADLVDRIDRAMADAVSDARDELRQAAKERDGELLARVGNHLDEKISLLQRDQGEAARRQEACLEGIRSGLQAQVRTEETLGKNQEGLLHEIKALHATVRTLQANLDQVQAALDGQARASAALEARGGGLERRMDGCIAALETIATTVQRPAWRRFFGA